MTLLTFFMGKQWLPETYKDFLLLICILASGITFFVLHLARHCGFVVVRRSAKATEEAGEYLWQPRSQDFPSYFRESIPTPQRIIRYSRRQVDKYGQDSFYKIKLSAEENILMLLESKDDRAMYVKLADRMHNIRTIQGQSLTGQERIAKETLQFFCTSSPALRAARGS